ncbi:MFS transporter [Siminovitchia terrae]|uniref:MFS transporter n=1 Tax=Siminovitchia terrae TaxID=1914933 RepID=A0A429X2C7_SIMTE|nr:MFS transporter [Siminovitchia terrae]RST57543.1 MFS transporter [Siminovitchia terrae]GIN90464.1 putative MFS-type transporter YxlH [Siminovitchia terrae]
MKAIPTVKDRYIFLIVSFIFWVSQFIYVPVLAPYIESSGGKYTFVGLVLGSYGIMQLVFRMPIGIFSDLIKKRKPLVIAGMVICALSCFVFAITDHLAWILAARSMAGLAAATWVIFTVLYAGYFSDKHIHRAMGMISFIIVLAQFSGMFLSGYLVDHWGWKTPFWTGAIICTVGVGLSFFINDSQESLNSQPLKLKDLLSVITDSTLLKVSILSIVAHGILFTTMFGFTPAYALKIGFQTHEISMVVIAFMIPHAISAILSGKLFVPILGQWRTLQFAFSLVACFTFLTPFVTNKLPFYLLQGLNGFSLGILYPVLLAFAIEKIPSQKRATAMGVYQALYALGMFVGPFLGGILNSYIGISGAFYLSGISGAIAMILSFLWGTKEQNKLPSKAQPK